MRIDVRKITEEHIDGFGRALDSVARERKYLVFLEAPEFATVQTYVRENIAEEHTHYVAIEDGIVVGWCDIVGYKRPVERHCGKLGIGIVSRFRGRGIGNRLMNAALDHAAKRGLTRIELTVREENTRARALYERFGFVVEGLTRGSTCIDGVYSNDILMARIDPAILR